jgi:hypothetical protein
MPIAAAGLLVDVKALRHQNVELVLCTCHRDIEQAAFLFDFLSGTSRKIGRDAAIDGIQHEYCGPFLTFCRMDRRQDEIVLIKERRASLVARCVGWVERELRQETFAIRIARGDLFELHQIGFAGGRVVMDAFEVGLIPSPHRFDLRRPTDESL